MNAIYLPNDLRGWLDRARWDAPMTSPALHEVVARVCVNPASSSDALLILADALTEASHEVQYGSLERRAELRKLADLPRALAPTRAAVPVVQDDFH